MYTVISQQAADGLQMNAITPLISFHNTMKSSLLLQTVVILFS